TEYQAVVAVELIPRLGPDQSTGHPEVEEQDRAVGAGEEPLPAALRLLEPPAAEVSGHGFRVRVPQHSGVAHLRSLDSPAHRVSGQQAPEALDVREFWHRLPSRHAIIFDDSQSREVRP